MKFVCKCEELKKEIGYAATFSSKRNALSITSNILLENSNNTLTIRSTDLKSGFTSTINVETIVPGRTTVTTDKFLEILKNLDSNIDLEISEENDKLTIKGLSGDIFEVNIRTVDPSLFPSLEEIDEESMFTLGQSNFLDMITKTTYSVGKDETRLFLTGVYIERLEDGRLAMVSTDGKRLSCIKKNFEQEIPSFIPKIIPVSFLSSISMIAGNDGILSIGFKDNYIFANISGHMIYSTLLTGNYPNYERVIPSSFEHTCNVRTTDLINALNLNSVLIESKSRRIFFDINEEGIMLSVEDSDGNSRNIIKCDYQGPEIRITFNFNFLSDAVKKVDSEFLSFNINNATSAVGIKSEPESDYIFIIMPIQV